MPTAIKASVDSNHAGDLFTRKSTTGVVLRLGQHCVRASSNLQVSVGLNVAEAEYYALVDGSARGLGMQTFMRDLGIDLSITVESDSNSAKSFACRLGLGKQRHVQTRFLWLQERVAAHDVMIVKIASGNNVADMLTKVIDTATQTKHMRTLAVEDCYSAKQFQA